MKGFHRPTVGVVVVVVIVLLLAYHFLGRARKG